MKLPLYKITLLAAALSALVPAAKGQTLTYNKGDLFIGFRNAASDYDYLVDLGPYTKFTLENGAQTVLLTGAFTSGSGLNTDLTSAGLTSGTFGVFGTLANGTGGLYAVFGTEMETPAGSPTSGQAPPSLGGFNTPNSGIASMGSQFIKGTDTGDGSDPTQVDGSVSQSLIQHITADTNPNTAPNNYSSYLQAANAFGYFTTPYEGSYAPSTQSDILDLYQFTRSASTATLLGSFDITPSGSLVFQSVPEPSSLMAVLSGAAVLVAFRRRRALR